MCVFGWLMLYMYYYYLYSFIWETNNWFEFGENSKVS